MLKIINKTDRDITISKNLELKGNSYLTINSQITPKLQQLLNMNLIKIQEFENERAGYIPQAVSMAKANRDSILNQIKLGNTQPGIPLYSLEIEKQDKKEQASKKRNSKK